MLCLKKEVYLVKGVVLALLLQFWVRTPQWECKKGAVNVTHRLVFEHSALEIGVIWEGYGIFRR